MQGLWMNVLTALKNLGSSASLHVGSNMHHQSPPGIFGRSSLIPSRNRWSDAENSLFRYAGNLRPKRWRIIDFRHKSGRKAANDAKFPVRFPDRREFVLSSIVSTWPEELHPMHLERELICARPKKFEMRPHWHRA